jgi:hypothetical protein
MSKLFAKELGALNLPTTLTNMSLIGDRVRKHRVVRKHTLTPTPNKSDLVIASYPYLNKKESATISIATAMKKYNLFANMNFRSKDKVALHTAQYIIAHRYVVSDQSKILKAMANGLGYSGNYYKLEEILKLRQEEEDDLTDNELKFLDYCNVQLPYCSEPHNDKMSTTAVDMLLEGASMKEVMSFIVPHAPFYMHIKRQELANYCVSALRLHYPPNSNIPEQYLHRDAKQLTDTVCQLFNVCSNGKSYARSLQLVGDYKWNSELQKYKARPLNKSQLRRRVNKLVRILTLNDLDYWTKKQMSRYGFADKDGELDTEKSIKLASDEYLEMLMKQSLTDVDDTVLTLPDGISKELADRIKEEAEHYHERNLIDYAIDEFGVHGVAKVKPFVPNHRIQKAIREITRRSSDTGVVPKKMYRLTTDRKVFNVKSTTLGGSLMIDFSGSMSWNEQDVREVIDLLPAANIAGYTGYGYKIDDCDGMIEIIAKDGKLNTKAIDNLYEHGYNSVDLQALKWLAEQPEPRIWISDQQVVGVGSDGSSKNLPLTLRHEIAQFMIKNNIIPIKAKELVKGLAKQLARR